jgi:hypothetical protein
LPDGLWVEAGIGETRQIRILAGRIVEARIVLDGALVAGNVVQARLSSVGQDGRNAIALTEAGAEILLPARPAKVVEGAVIAIEITREAIPGTEPWKRPLGRPGPLKASSGALGGEALPFPPPAGKDALEHAGWSDLLDEARSGTVSFPGGTLRLSPTPAMTLIDVDGTLAPETLAVAGAAAAGSAIRRLGIGGSIGIDLPTVRGKDARNAAAAALDRTMGNDRFERTGVNGFGFLQIIRPRRHASLLELASDQPAFEARALLRRAAVAGHGACCLAVHPTVAAVLEAQPAWLAVLSRQRGGAITLRADPHLAMAAGHAERA